ncbi:MAG: hypothetical protein NTY64_15140, partial [Deltaproteobacteria bacterium]|nr:hypothetical protein [Deltaproteobacteria bacterium]
ATCLFGINPDLRIGRYLALCYVFIAGVGIFLLKRTPAAGILFIYLSVICAVHRGTPVFFSFSVALYGVVLIYLINQKLDKDRIYDAICGIAILNVIWQALQAMGFWVGIKPLFPDVTLLTWPSAPPPSSEKNGFTCSPFPWPG